MTVISKYLREIKGRLSSQTVEQYAMRLGRFSKWQRSQGTRTFDKKNARDFLVWLEKKEFGPASISLHKATLSAFYTWLAQNDIIEANPIGAINLGRYHSPKKSNECTFTEAQYSILKEHAEGEWKGAIIIGWNTGLRLADVCNFSMERVNMVEKRITLVPQKTRRLEKVVDIPILPELYTFLLGQPLEGAHVLPAMQREYAENGSKNLSLQFSRICGKAGLEGKTYHSLRHTLCSRLLNKGVPLSMVSSITGHTLDVLQRYSHAGFAEAQQRVEEALA